METVRTEIDRGNVLSQDSLRVLDQIVSISTEVMDSSHQIVSAVMQENRSIEEITDNLTAMATGSNEAAKAVRNLAVTAEDLSTQAERLQTQIERFKT
jgi:methyl-accepting chemotaxis protein